MEALDRESLTEVLENLSYRERRVLELRFGFGGEGHHSHEEIGQTFSLSTARVGSIESIALKKILSLVAAHGLRDDVENGVAG